MMSIAPLLVVLLRILSLKYGHAAVAKMGQEVDTFVGSHDAVSPGTVRLHQLRFTSPSRAATVRLPRPLALALL